MSHYNHRNKKYKQINLPVILMSSINSIAVYTFYDSTLRQNRTSDWH